MRPSQEEIQAALSEIHPQLAEASRAAFKHWLRIPPAQRAALDHPRTYANAIWGFFRAEALARFSSDAGRRAHPPVQYRWESWCKIACTFDSSASIA